MTKKILAIFLTIAMCLTLMPVTAFAATKIENINISEEGILTFDEVPGAVRYDVDIIRHDVDIVSAGREGYVLRVAVSLGTNIFETIMERYKFPTSDYKLCMYAYDSANNCCAASSNGDDVYRFSYESPLIEITQPSNLRWDGYIARCDEVPNSKEYRFELYNKHGHSIVIRKEEDSFCDYTEYAMEEGYYFTVKAIGKDGYLDSEISKSLRMERPTAVREVNIVVTPPVAGKVPDYNASTGGCEKTLLSFFASPFLQLLCIND